MKTFLFFEPKAKSSPPPPSPPRCYALYTFNFSLRREYFSKDYMALKHIIYYQLSMETLSEDTFKKNIAK